MSGDPERLLSASSDADELERELLASVRHVHPPRGAQAHVWSGLAAQLAAATLVTAAHGSLGVATSGGGASAAAAAPAAGSAVASGAAASGATKTGFGVLSKALVAKLGVAVALGVAAAGAGTLWVATHESPQRLVRHAWPAPSAVVSGLEQRPSVTEPALDGAPSPSSTKRPLATRRAAATADRLAAESQLLAEARAQLRSGDVAAARGSLKRLRTRFPKGGLRQEREVLAIEVLSERGNTRATEQRARAFIKAHPESPHSQNLRRFLGRP
ncbi:MAG TPA: hypothetical protein VK524_17615 [Polyangiaceae bacterium]|nr:hypothetical protein [Polyangiaceae bacterium]